MNSRSKILNWLILVCAVLIFLTAYYVGLVAIPLSMNTEVTLVIVTVILTGFILLGEFGRINEIDEISFSRHRKGTLISGILIVVTLVFVLLDIHPPGMSPEVPFLFVIPPLALVIVLAVLIEKLVLPMKLDQSK